MVEQGTHKPLVVGSNPTLAILCLSPFDPSRFYQDHILLEVDDE